MAVGLSDAKSTFAKETRAHIDAYRAKLEEFGERLPAAEKEFTEEETNLNAADEKVEDYQHLLS